MVTKKVAKLVKKSISANLMKMPDIVGNELARDSYKWSVQEGQL